MTVVAVATGGQTRAVAVPEPARALFAATLAVCALCWVRIDAEESMVGE